MKKLKFMVQCFFCEKGIAKKGQDPVTLLAMGAKPVVDGLRKERPSQTFWCHCKCLAQRVGDPYSLNPDLGGKEMPFYRSKTVKRWLKRRKS